MGLRAAEGSCWVLQRPSCWVACSLGRSQTHGISPDMSAMPGSSFPLPFSHPLLHNKVAANKSEFFTPLSIYVGGWTAMSLWGQVSIVTSDFWG